MTTPDTTCGLWTREVRLTSHEENRNAHHVPEVRRWFRALPFQVAAARALDDAETCLSELVTNSIRHSMSPVFRDDPIHVTVIDTGDAIRVEVIDRPSVWARTREAFRRAGAPAARPVDLNAEEGRGLVIVEALSRAYDVEDDEAGRCTWFEVAYSPTAVTQSGQPAVTVARRDPSPVLPVIFPPRPAPPGGTDALSGARPISDSGAGPTSHNSTARKVPHSERQSLPTAHHMH